MSLKLPPSVRNWVSLTGAVIVLITFFMIAFLFVVTLFQTGQAAYLGLVTYILLPSVMIIGLLLIPIGMLLEIRREHREGTIAEPGWPRIDLNIPHYRHAFFIFSVGTAFFLFISAIGSYEAFHYTESVSFCGTLCHQVMNPEYTAHANSPHAKVPCVDCHVGPGAGWYVRSKLSGLYQVYAVTTNVYPRPIPTPIENLRPARAVCEQCHWPEKFYGHIIQTKTHYLPDKDNTPWKIRLSLKIGPPEAALGLVEGIHWHINPKVKVEYIATDDRRQKIPWVRVTYLDTGKVKVFEDKNNPLSPAQVQNAEHPDHGLHRLPQPPLPLVPGSLPVRQHGHDGRGDPSRAAGNQIRGGQARRRQIRLAGGCQPEDRERTDRLLSEKLSRRFQKSSGLGEKGGHRFAGRLRPQYLSRHESTLERLSRQYRPPGVSRLFSLSQRESRNEIRGNHQQKL